MQLCCCLIEISSRSSRQAVLEVFLDYKLRVILLSSDGSRFPRFFLSKKDFKTRKKSDAVNATSAAASIVVALGCQIQRFETFSWNSGNHRIRRDHALHAVFVLPYVLQLSY